MVKQKFSWLLTYLFIQQSLRGYTPTAYLDTGNLNHEHRCTKYMPGIVAPELDSSDLSLLVKVHGLNAVHAGLNVFLGVQHLVCGDVANFHVVRQQPAKHKYNYVSPYEVKAKASDSYIARLTGKPHQPRSTTIEVTIDQ